MTESEGSIVALFEAIYRATLARCEPGTMLRDAARSRRVSIPGDIGSIVAVGKCAAPLAKAAAEMTGVIEGLVIHPDGYGTDVILPDRFERLAGSHPVPSAASRIAAQRASAFVRSRREPILFLVSGGASACMEDCLAPHVTFEDLVRINELLVSSGLAIEAINTVRGHLSAVKGGRLGALAPPGSVTLVYSDVPPGRPELVGSGPTAGDPATRAAAAAILRALGDGRATRLAEKLEEGLIPETETVSPTRLEVIADSRALIDAASVACRARGFQPKPGRSLDGEVGDVARALVSDAEDLGAKEILVVAGESTVAVRAAGRGGRCTELAARLVLAADATTSHGVCGLFGSSDGRDGSSPAAAVIVRPSGSRRLDPERAAEALDRSASYELVADYGEPIIMMPTGNNLRDLALVFRGR